MGVDTGGVGKIAGTLGAFILLGAGIVTAGTVPVAAGDGCLLEDCRAGKLTGGDSDDAPATFPVAAGDGCLLDCCQAGVYSYHSSSLSSHNSGILGSSLPSLVDGKSSTGAGNCSLSEEVV